MAGEGGPRKWAETLSLEMVRGLRVLAGGLGMEPTAGKAHLIYSLFNIDGIKIEQGWDYFSRGHQWMERLSLVAAKRHLERLLTVKRAIGDSRVCNKKGHIKGTGNNRI